jgi:Na+/glutamate symporter
LGPEILGHLTGEASPWLTNGIFPEDMLRVWRELPALLITVIFAPIFLGKKIPPMTKIWKIAGPQLAFGQIMAWGQYVVGIAVVMLVLIGIFTAASGPLIVHWGLVPVLILTSALGIGWFIFGYLTFGRKRK